MADTAGEDRKLFVGGLSWETKEPQLREYFEKYGEIESINLKLDSMTGRSRGFAFIVFTAASSLDNVIAAGDHAINSKKVDVKKAKAKPGKIFVGGLKPEITDEQIKDYFGSFGAIIECEMPHDKSKNQRKGFCFITFEREETMKELLKSPKQKIGEVEIDVKRATPKPAEGAFGFPPARGGARGAPRGARGARGARGGRGGSAFGGGAGFGGYGSYGGDYYGYGYPPATDYYGYGSGGYGGYGDYYGYGPYNPGYAGAQSFGGGKSVRGRGGPKGAARPAPY